MTFPSLPDCRVNLHNIELSRVLSEETLAFSADILIDGEPAGRVRNDGHGGCHTYTLPSTRRALRDEWLRLGGSPDAFEAPDRLVYALLLEEVTP